MKNSNQKAEKQTKKYGCTRKERVFVMNYRKVLAVALAASMLVPAGNIFAADSESTDITLWTYPIGNWGDAVL